jgi:hypothetical protein
MPDPCLFEFWSLFAKLYQKSTVLMIDGVNRYLVWLIVRLSFDMYLPRSFFQDSSGVPDNRLPAKTCHIVGGDRCQIEARFSDNGPCSRTRKRPQLPGSLANHHQPVILIQDAWDDQLGEIPIKAVAAHQMVACIIPFSIDTAP